MFKNMLMPRRIPCGMGLTSRRQDTTYHLNTSHTGIRVSASMKEQGWLAQPTNSLRSRTCACGSDGTSSRKKLYGLRCTFAERANAEDVLHWPPAARSTKGECRHCFATCAKACTQQPV